MTVVKRGFGLLFLTLVSACSPYVYKDGITKFSADVSTAMSSDKDMQSQVSEVRNSAQEEFYALRREPVTTNPPNCIAAPGATSSGCTIVSVNPAAEAVANNGPITTLTLPIIIKQLNAVSQVSTMYQPRLAVLSNYVTNLAALTNAGDQAALDTAIKGLGDSVAAGVKSVDKTATDSAIAGAITTAVGDVGGLYLEARRYKALKSAVTFWDNSLLTDVTFYLSADLSGAKDVLLAYYSYELIQLRAALAPGAARRLSEQQYRAKYDELQEDVTASTKLASVDPAGAIKAIVAAHHSLALALQSGQGQFAAFQADLDTLSKDVSALQTALSTKSTASTSGKSKTAGS